MCRFLTSGLVILALPGVLYAEPPKAPVNSRFVTVQNDYLKVGVDLDHGGAITWLSAEAETTPEQWRSVNVVNNFDLGRQIQMSHYSGPIPFAPEGRQPAAHWRKLGWNPVQAGDHFGNGSEVLTYRVRGSRIEVESRPMQWPLDGVPADAVYKTQIQLCGRNVIVAASVELNRESAVPADVIARHQEIPAVYLLSAFSRIWSSVDGTLTRVQHNPASGSPWTYWKPSAPWAIAADEDGFGVGVFSASAEQFAGGVAGSDSSRDTNSPDTTYLAPIRTSALPLKGRFDYRFVISPGSVEELAEHFKTIDRLTQTVVE